MGGAGAVHGMHEGSLFIDMASIQPREARDHAARLGERGVRHLDAPVSGGTVGAENGTLAILVGGYDRGLDWGVFAERIAAEPVAAIITMGQNGPRVFEKLKPLALGERFVLAEAGDLDEAVKLGLQALGSEGVLLLSPGAPSFPRYRDYVERGRHFAKLAGYDPDLINAIPGLGVA